MYNIFEDEAKIKRIENYLLSLELDEELSVKKEDKLKKSTKI